jgi:hypothetical protein
MTQTLLSKKTCALRRFRLANIALTSEAHGKDASAKQIHLRFGRKAKYMLAFAILAVLLISFFSSLLMQNSKTAQWLGIDVPPTQTKSSGLVESGQPYNTSAWLSVAANAWAYFQPGVGVDPNTGLPYAAGTNFKAFTAWDLGCYIQAVIDAQKLGLVSTGGAWGSSARLEKIINFLENRPLNATTGYPFWYYDATNGQDYHAFSDKATSPVDVVDTGRLFVALNNLRNYNSSLAASIDYIVYNQSNYAALLPSVESNAASNSVYAYYFDSGFASFWPQQVGNVPSEVMNNIVNTRSVKTYGVSLPDTAITCEPLLCSVFELDSNNAQLNSLMKQVYLAHEAYYDATGHYVAFSEGNSFTSQYIYEWIVAPNGNTWKITNNVQNTYYNIKPIIYTKVAFSFLALYNSTFAQNLVAYLLNMLPNPSNGYSDGADNNGQCVSGAGSNTNSLILDAALYAIQNQS